MQKKPLFIGLGFVLAAVVAFGLFGTKSEAASPVSFTRPVIDIGVVVTDLDRSLRFYEEVVGMRRKRSFDLDEDFGARSGLTDGRPVHIEVLELESGEHATEWKLMSFGEDTPRQENAYIHDHTGVQYITIHVAALNPILERIRAHDVELLGDTPTPLGGANHFVLIQDPDGTFVELIGPMDAE